MGGKKNPMHMITFILLVIGGLNWLIFGLSGQDVGSWIGGMMSVQAKVIYVLVGLAAIYEVAMHKANCKMCGNGGGMKSGGSMGGQQGGGQM